MEWTDTKKRGGGLAHHTTLQDSKGQVKRFADNVQVCVRRHSSWVPQADVPPVA